MDMDNGELHLLAEKKMTLRSLLKAQLIQLSDESNANHPTFCSFLVKSEYFENDKFEEVELHKVYLESELDLTLTNRKASYSLETIR